MAAPWRPAGARRRRRQLPLMGYGAPCPTFLDAAHVGDAHGTIDHVRVRDRWPSLLCPRFWSSRGIRDNNQKKEQTQQPNEKFAQKCRVQLKNAGAGIKRRAVLCLEETSDNRRRCRQNRHNRSAFGWPALPRFVFFSPLSFSAPLLPPPSSSRALFLAHHQHPPAEEEKYLSPSGNPNEPP